MRNLLAFLAAALLAFLGLGWYFNWYTIQSVPLSQGHQGFTIDVNKDKIGKDVIKGAGKVQQALEKHQQADPGAPITQPQVPASGIQQTGGVVPAIKINTVEPIPPTPHPQQQP